MYSAEISYTGILMAAELNYDLHFSFKSTFDLQIQDGGLWSLPKYSEIEFKLISNAYIRIKSSN